MEVFENLAAEAEKRIASAITWSRKIDVDLAIDSARRRGHDKDAIAHVDRLINVVGNEQHGGATILPQAQHFVLHPHAGEGVEGAERLIKQEYFGMIDECACKRDTLGHPTGKMVRICIRKCFESDQPHEFAHFRSVFMQDSAGNEPSLNIPANGQPWK